MGKKEEILSEETQGSETMTSFQKVEQDITCYKPKMHQAKALKEVPFIFGTKNITVQVKADGEFNYVKYSREGETFMINRFGRKTTNLPCLYELVELLKKWNMVEAELLAELYAVKDGKPLTLPNLIHYLKGTDHSLQNFIKLGVFDLLSINGVKSDLIYPMKYFTMSQWFEAGSLVHVLPWSEPTKFDSVQNFWNEKVEGEKWEGLVIRLNGETWKVKPNCDIDVAIIGINKNNKGFDEGKARSLKMGLMNEDGNFVEIGDCSGVGDEESQELFELVRNFRIGEDNTTVFVQPVVIATIEYIQTYPDTRNKVYRIENGQIKETGEATLVRLRNPHVKGYRADKKACIEDVGLNQIS
jgi:ATP-dependent DNA ligase